MSVLQKHEPSYIFFNAGLCCTANYPRNQPYRAVSRIIEGQTSKKWDEYVKSKALMAWSSGESAAFYQAGLRQYVQLLTDQLPSAKLLWVRTSAPREEKWRPEWRLPDANLTLVKTPWSLTSLNP